jgi:predicted Zn-dependent protease
MQLPSHPFFPFAASIGIQPKKGSLSHMDKIALLTEILERNPDDAFARYGLAMERANQGQTDAALAEFDRLIAAHPDYVPAYQMSGQLLVRAGRPDQARHHLQLGIDAAHRAGNAHAISEMNALLDEIASAP